METRANHILIGGFTLAVILGAMLFVLWLAKIEIDQRFAYYDILFEGSVTGLSVAGDVRYKGVRVGQVKEIKIYEKDPKFVRVRIEVDANTPVYTTTNASLEFFGITGVLFVQIQGSEIDGKPLTPQTGQDVAMIPAGKSSLEELFAGAPRLVENAGLLIERLSMLVDEQNRTSLENILNNVESVSGSIAKRSADIEEVIKNSGKMSRDLSEVSANINSLTARLDRLAVTAEATLDKDVRKLLADAGGTARSFGAMADEMQSILKDNKPAINNFGDKGLREFASFVVEARQLVTTLDRVAQRMESDPARFFLGTSASEYQPQ